MILTGKAKEDFSKFYIDNNFDLNINFKNLPKIYQNALIVEFFDSVGIYINVELDYLHLVWFPTINNNWTFEEVEFKTRQEAIKKANEIYNNK